MLVVEKNSVYEIDEECLKQRTVPEECEVYQKLVQQNGKVEKEASVPVKSQMTKRYKSTRKKEQDI